MIYFKYEIQRICHTPLSSCHFLSSLPFAVSFSFPVSFKGEMREGSCHTEKKRTICWLKILHVSTNPNCLGFTKLSNRPGNDRNGLVCACVCNAYYLDPSLNEAVS